MSYLSLYFEAHQPRRLKKDPTLASPFDDVMDREILHRVAEKCYLRANEMFARLVHENPEFRVCISVTGTLLEQARRFNPALLASFQKLARTGAETGRIEFLAETYYHSLTGLFRDGNKEEFRTQIELHAAILSELLGVAPTSLRNTELLYNNSIAAVAGAMGYKSILCERRPDMVSGHSPNAVFQDRLMRIRVLPRNDGLSDELAFRFTHRHFTAEDFAQWIARIDGEAVLIGMDYEAIGEHQWEDTGIFDFWQHLPQALTEHPNILMRTPSEIAKEQFRDAPVADIDDLATSSWADEGRNTNAWLGNRAQQDLFSRYQDMEAQVKALGDPNLVAVWRNLGTSDNYYYMCTTRHGADGGVHAYFSHFADVSQAIMAYTTVLTELRANLVDTKRTIQIKKKAWRPRILLVTPEVTELPPGIGNLANFVSAKGGGLADISAALVAEMVRLGLDIHVAVPKYDRQMREHANISQQELDRLVALFDNSEPIHLAQDSSFAHVREVYERFGGNTALRRALAFQRAVINEIIRDAMPPHGKMLIHCNDWMTGLIPAAAKARGLPCVFTLHNIHTDRDTLRRIETFGIDVTRFWHDLYLEKHPEAVPNPWETIGVDFLLSGVKAASYTNTVSPTFLIEIINGFFPELFPTPLREELRAKHSLGCASGILNAPMNSVDPRLAPLRRNYDETTVIEGKRANKIAFQEELGLQANPDAPLFFWPHRLYPQKGPHLLAEIAMPLVQHYWNEGLQIAVVGSGDPKWEQAFGALSYASHGRIAFRSFDPLLSEVGKAAADYVLMPSLYEPCGLPQMEGPRYGALPIVRSTGGLRDTIEHLAPSGETGNGFVFNDFVPDALWWACTEAMRFQAQPLEWRAAVIRRVMSEARAKFNLEVTTLKYVRIYERLLGEKLL